jgi:DNA-binding transcriptional LysR family regulator
MTEFSNTELRRLDLTVLLVFLGLIKSRKARVVAAELGLTQSAISQALRRLRDIFGDPLFLRRPHGLEPTATALALEAPVAAAVDALRGAIDAARAFDPVIATGVLRLAALDAEQAVLVPPLAARLRARAPGLTLSVLPLARSAAMDALTEGRADLALGYAWDVPQVIAGEVLYEEEFLVAGRKAALPQAPHLDLDTYCTADHILVSPSGDLRGIVDEQLAAMGRSRRVILGLPDFLPALVAVAQTGALVTLPSRLAKALAPDFGLITAAPPLPLRRFRVSAFWHRRNDADPRLIWIRQQLLDCL